MRILAVLLVLSCTGLAEAASKDASGQSGAARVATEQQPRAMPTRTPPSAPDPARATAPRRAPTALDPARAAAPRTPQSPLGSAPATGTANPSAKQGFPPAPTDSRAAAERRRTTIGQTDCGYGFGAERVDDSWWWYYGKPCFGVATGTLTVGQRGSRSIQYVSAPSGVLLEAPADFATVAFDWDELPLQPGNHTISFRKPGYKPLDVVFDAAAPADDGVVKGFLRIRLEPDDAVVYLDGKRLGTASDLARLDGAIPLERDDPALVAFALEARNP